MSNNSARTSYPGISKPSTFLGEETTRSTSIQQVDFLGRIPEVNTFQLTTREEVAMESHPTDIAAQPTELTTETLSMIVHETVRNKHI